MNIDKISSTERSGAAGGRATVPIHLILWSCYARNISHVRLA